MAAGGRRQTHEDWIRRLVPRASVPVELELLRQDQYRRAFAAVRGLLAQTIKAANNEEVETMESHKVALVDKDGVGINTLLRQSHKLFCDTVSGAITPQVASAAARNCGNILKGLELRAKYGEDALRF